MSQAGIINAATSSPAIVEIINGDTGSITGNVVTIFANRAANHAGSTVGFDNSGTVSTFSVTDGSNNTMIGKNCGNSVGFGNTFLGNGIASLGAMLSGAVFNTAIGNNCLSMLTSGRNNVLLAGSLSNITTGSYNIAIGTSSGNNYTSSETANICIASQGVTGDNSVLRIGTQGTGTVPVPMVNQCFIAGITGATVVGSTVLCSTSGQLGTIASSLRYKENVLDLGNASEDIYKLRPVKFNYKADKTRDLKYGLIAEEVQRDFPYLALYNAQGEPESVSYHELPVLLLAEIKKLRERIETLERRLS